MSKRETAAALRAAKDCPKCQTVGAYEAGIPCPDYNPPQKPKRETARQQEARRMLRKLLKPGATVYGIVRTVSRSGMSRTIDFFAMPSKRGDRPMYLSGYMANLLGYSRDRSGALKVTGCGMDMIFHTVYNLSSVLFADYKGKDATKLPEKIQRLFGRMGYYDNGKWVPNTTIRETGYLLKAETL